MTITAHNYAAQAEIATRQFGEATLRNGHQWDALGCKILASNIHRSVHFAIPDGGRIFDDELRGLDKIQLRLPFPSITIEYFLPLTPESQPPPNQPLVCPKRVIFAREVPSDDVKITQELKTKFPQLEIIDLGMADFWIMFGVVVYGAKISRWMPLTFGYFVPSNAFVGGIPPQGIQIPAIPFALLRDQEAFVLASFGVDQYRLVQKDTWDEFRIIAEFCEALTCSNVSSEIMPGSADERINRKRISKGKIPLYVTRRLVIDAPVDHQPRNPSEPSGRQSPRQHLRRGHIRILRNSKRIWINSCVVGKPSDGVVIKSYGVQKKQEE